MQWCCWVAQRRKFFFFRLFTGWGLLASGIAQAQIFSADWHSAAWQLETGPFACSLTQTVDGFGTAQFVHRAGGAEGFELRPIGSVRFPAGEIRASTKPSAWRGDQTPRTLARLDAGAEQNIKFSGQTLAALVDTLSEGSQVVFTGRVSAVEEKFIGLAIAPGNFAKAYETYRSCVGQLVPYTFSQLARITLHYKTGATTLSGAARTELDKVARYTNADKAVLGIVVDAHGDNGADSNAVSQTQAELVAQYLTGKGVANAMITSRWHGDKYPLASNALEAGRAKNRRITVRLENEKTRAALEQKIAAREKADQDLKAADSVGDQATSSLTPTSSMSLAQGALASDPAAKVKAKTSATAAGDLTLQQLQDMVENQDLGVKHRPSASTSR